MSITEEETTEEHKEEKNPLQKRQRQQDKLRQELGQMDRDKGQLIRRYGEIQEDIIKARMTRREVQTEQDCAC